MKPAVVVSIVFLLAVAFIHLLRLFFAVAVTVDGTSIPMWASVVASVGTIVLPIWLWWEERPVSAGAG